MMELKDEGFVAERELYHVWAVTFLPCPEGGFGFGIKSTDPCCKYFFDRIIALGSGGRDVDLVEGKSDEWW